MFINCCSKGVGKTFIWALLKSEVADSAIYKAIQSLYRCHMGVMASKSGVSVVCPATYSSKQQPKHQSSVSHALCEGIHQSPVDTPHKGPVKWQAYQCHDSSCSESNLSKVSKDLRLAHLADIHNLLVDSGRARSAPLIITDTGVMLSL